MVGKFSNSWSRVTRATYHAQSFLEERNLLFQEQSPNVAARFDKGSGWFIATVVIPDELALRFQTNTLALKIGECAYQLRAALDGLIWDAVTIYQGAELSFDAKGVNKLEFPILNGRNRDFKQCALYCTPFPIQLRDWIESIQPGSPEKPIHDPDRGIKNALEDIHDLARLDRHRKLHVVSAPVNEVEFSIGDVRPSEYELCDGFDLLSGRNELFRFRADTTLLPEKFRLYTKVTGDIEVEGVPFYSVPEDIGTRLARLIQAVHRVADVFENSFPEC